MDLNYIEKIELTDGITSLIYSLNKAPQVWGSKVISWKWQVCRTCKNGQKRSAFPMQCLSNLNSIPMVCNQQKEISKATETIQAQGSQKCNGYKSCLSFDGNGFWTKLRKKIFQFQRTSRWQQTIHIQYYLGLTYNGNGTTNKHFCRAKEVYLTK